MHRLISVLFVAVLAQACAMRYVPSSPSSRTWKDYDRSEISTQGTDSGEAEEEDEASTPESDVDASPEDSRIAKMRDQIARAARSTAGRRSGTKKGLPVASSRGGKAGVIGKASVRTRPGGGTEKRKTKRTHAKRRSVPEKTGPESDSVPAQEPGDRELYAERGAVPQEFKMEVASRSRRSERPRSPGIKAGFSDDNREFGAYLGFLEKYKRRVPIQIDVSNRIVIEAQDADGMPSPWASFVFKDMKGRVLVERHAYADGRAMFFPSEDSRFSRKGIRMVASWRGESQVVKIDPNGKKTVRVVFKRKTGHLDWVPVDICFLLDTTGSMGDEIGLLKRTLEVVHRGIAEATPRPRIRYGMTLYRDRGDEYVTRRIPFTDDVKAFHRQLARIEVHGGGDAPEDLQEGLREALTKMKWRERSVGIVFIVTDASTHVYREQKFDYAVAARQAAARGIKIVGIGASGLPVDGEIVLRQLGQYTMGQFVFLTYGETGESDGETRLSVSHHTGANYQTRNLDAIIVRFVRNELAAMQGKKLKPEDWLETTPGGDYEREKILDDLFAQGVRRLLDFSLVPVAEGTPTAVAPMFSKEKNLKMAAELLEHRLLQAVARHPAFKAVERRDLRQVLEEHALGLTGVMGEADAAKVGNIIGAKLMILSSLSSGATRHEVLLKLVRVETSEILAVSPLRVSRELVE